MKYARDAACSSSASPESTPKGGGDEDEAREADSSGVARPLEAARRNAGSIVGSCSIPASLFCAFTETWGQVAHNGEMLATRGEEQEGTDGEEEEEVVVVAKEEEEPVEYLMLEQIPNGALAATCAGAFARVPGASFGGAHVWQRVGGDDLFLFSAPTGADGSEAVWCVGRGAAMRARTARGWLVAAQGPTGPQQQRMPSPECAVRWQAHNGVQWASSAASVRAASTAEMLAHLVSSPVGKASGGGGGDSSSSGGGALATAGVGAAVEAGGAAATEARSPGSEAQKMSLWMTHTAYRQLVLGHMPERGGPGVGGAGGLDRKAVAQLLRGEAAGGEEEGLLWGAQPQHWEVGGGGPGFVLGGQCGQRTAGAGAQGHT